MFNFETTIKFTNILIFIYSLMFIYLISVEFFIKANKSKRNYYIAISISSICLILAFNLFLLFFMNNKILCITSLVMELIFLFTIYILYNSNKNMIKELDLIYKLKNKN